jgi:hypothetical protein
MHTSELNRKKPLQLKHKEGQSAMKRNGTIERAPSHGRKDQPVLRLLPLKKAAEVLGLTVRAICKRIYSADFLAIRFPGT